MASSRCAVLLLAALSASAPQLAVAGSNGTEVQSEGFNFPFKVCGNYCGPSWCSGKYQREGACKATAAPAGCADRCCMIHDMCCGDGAHGRPNAVPFSGCNKAVVSCLRRCERDTSCHNGDREVPPLLVEIAMSLVGTWCCGTQCSAAMLMTKAQEVLNANASTPNSLPALRGTVAAAVSQEFNASEEELHP
mmetsp:Transcript_49290/g.127120  ORF Transcript_49290/g.127120 Transcript_49290/m.127120 type:complete len:192 (-) Transcript_49290:340-915(-)|eukprot:CAMPEP_0195101688 /NCGR_PEP_ID=MMETSP0448-20130528/65262_1 /TAXON_ID=66468 /ORGANISM="Heterocapsa triquestra, Strain CCMP 448" /LENGTH=191 /DNA_ID=CAMNT_0040137041 /DNA_START=66 /DNA_END=641 /DNA_ORIENTATION=-